MTEKRTQGCGDRTLHRVYHYLMQE